MFTDNIRKIYHHLVGAHNGRGFYWWKARGAGRRVGLHPMMTLILVCSIFMMPNCSWGAEPAISTPFFSVGLDSAGQPGAPTVVLQIFLLMTVLSLAPAILIMVTSFTRIVIVLSLLRRALGTMQMPPNQVMIGLALFLTFFCHGAGVAQN